MSDQLPLALNQDSYSIDGYVPPLTRHEALLGYHLKISEPGKFRGFGVYDEDDDRSYRPPVETHSITIGGTVIYGREHVIGIKPDGIEKHDSVWSIVAKIANQFLFDKENEKRHPEAWKYLTNNTDKLNKSKRYWHAYDHRKKIAEEEAKVVHMQERIKRAKLTQQLFAYEFINNITLSDDERRKMWAEISEGLPYGNPYHGEG